VSDDILGDLAVEQDAQATPPAAEMDEFDLLAAEQDQAKADRLGRIGDVIASTANPDRRAAVLELVRKTGADPAYVESNFDFWKNQADSVGRDPERLDRELPDLAQIMVDQPWLGQVVYRDDELWKVKAALQGITGRIGQSMAGFISKLPMDVSGPKKVATVQAKSAGLEGTARYFGQTTGTRPATLEEQIHALETGVGLIDTVEERQPGIIGEAVGRSTRQMKLGPLAMQYIANKAMGKDTYPVELEAAGIQSDAVARDYREGPAEQVLLDAIEFIPSQGASYAGAGAGFVVAGPPGAVAGGFLTSFTLELNSLWEYRQMRTDDGKAIPDEVAIGAAVVGALGKAAIETGVMFGVGLKAFGPLGQAMTGVERKAIVKALMRDQTNWTRLAKAGEAWGKMAAGEGFGEESTQALVEDVTGWLARSGVAGKAQKADVGGSVANAVGAGVKGTVGAFFLGAGGFATNIGTQAVIRDQSERAAQQIAAIAPAIATSNTAKAAPAVFAQQVADETRKSGEPVTAAYVDPQGIIRLAQGSNMDPAEMVRDLAGDEGVVAFKEALATGSKMEVPLQEYVEKWGTKGIAEALVEDTTTRPEFMTAREIAEGDKVRQSDIEKAHKLIDEEEKPASAVDVLVEQVVTDLVESGRWKKGDAKTAAKLIRKGIATKAVRSGLLPETVAKETVIRLANLEGVRPETKAAVEGYAQEPKEIPVGVKPGKPTTPDEWKTLTDRRNARVDEIVDAGEQALSFPDPSRPAGAVTIIHRSPGPGRDGKWRVTDIDADGVTPTGHEEAGDFKSAVKAALQRGADIWAAPGRMASLKQDERGFVEMVSEGSKRLYTILLGKKADASTFFHEAGHIFLDLSKNLAERPDAPQAVKDDWTKTLAFLGVKDGEAIDTKHHEKWARAFEAYLYEGKAPSKSLAGAFQQFKLWMREVYRSISALNVELDDDIRGVMDRMLATDEEIAKAKAAAGMDALGLSEAEVKAHGDAMSAASHRVESEAIQESLRVTEKWWRDALTKEKAAAFEAYKELPASKAWAFLRRAATSGNPSLEILLGEAKKERAKAKPEELNAAEKAKLAKVDAKVAAIEAKRATGTGHPIGPLSMVRKVVAVQVPSEPGGVLRMPGQPLLEEWTPGMGMDPDWKLVEVTLPEWLSLDDYMRDQEAWSWVWRTTRGMSAPKGIQELLLFYAKQALDDVTTAGVTPADRLTSFSRLELVARYFGYANDPDGRKRSTFERIGAWLALPKSQRTSDPIPDGTWNRLFTKAREASVADWFRAVAADRRRGVWPWIKETTEAEAAKPKSPEDLEADADRAKLTALDAERRQILDDAHGRMVAEASPHLKLDYQAVADLVGSKVKGIFRGVTSASSKGEHLDPEVLASAVGTKDAATLLDEMERTADAAAWVKADAERRMAEKHPDILDERSRLRKMAEKAVHGEPTLSWLLRQGQELRIRAKGKGSAKVEALRAAAEEIIRKQPIGALRAYRYLQAERAAAKRKTGAVAAGDFGAAYLEWQKQVINYFLFREATMQLEERERFYKVAAKMEDKLGELGLSSPVFRDVADKVLVALGLKEPLPADPENPLGANLSDLARRFEDEEIAVGYDETIIAGLLAKPKAAADLTVGEMTEVLRLLSQIRAASWRTGKVQFQNRIVARDALLGDMRSEATRLPLRKAPAKAMTQAKMGQGEKARILSSINAARRNPKVLLERLGPTAKAFFYDRVNAGLKVEHELTQRVLLAWTKALDQLPADMKRRRYEVVDTSAFPYPSDVWREGKTDREWLWLAAFNMGNQSNESRLTGGYGWDAEAFREFLLDTLTTEEWKFIQGVGDIMEDVLYKAMADEFEKHNGTRPEKIPPKPIVLRDGTVLRGYYFPAKYDPVNSRTGQAQEIAGGLKEMQGRDYAKATMSKSFTKARVKEYTDVVELSNLGVLTNHLFDVIHYIAFEGVVRDFNKVLPHLEQSITQRLGREYFWSLAGWAQTVANPREQIGKDTWGVFRALGLTRASFIFSTMAYNLRVALGDLSNPFTAMIGKWHETAVRPDHVAGALAQANTVVGFPSMLKFAKESSDIIKRDFDHQGQRLRDELQAVGAKGKRARVPGTVIEPGRMLDWVHQGAYVLFHWSSVLTETVVWTAAYRDGQAQGKDHDAAVKFADEIIEDNFPRSEVLKQPAILRSKQGIGSLLAFFGYFSTMENKQARLAFPAIVKWQKAEGFAEHAKVLPLGVKVASQVLALYFVTNVVGELLSGRGPDEDEETPDWIKRKMAVAPLTYQPFMGEGAALLESMMSEPGKRKRISERSAPATAAMSRFFVALEKAASDDSEDAAKFWATYEAGALLFRLPVSQVKRTVPYLWDVKEGNENPKSWTEFLQKSIYGANPNAADNPVTFIEEEAR
jgi:hypothetical protein